MRLIDADELKRVVLRAFPPVAYDQALLVGRIIDRMPTIDPVKHGRWIISDGCVCCSECGEPNMEWNYCPYCGARMQEGEEDG